MARSAHAVSRMRSPGMAAAVWAVLLAAVLTLLGPVALGGAQGGTAGSPVLGAGAEPTPGEPYADAADPAVSTAAVRSQAEGAAERLVPPAVVQATSPGANQLRPARRPVAVVGPAVSEHPAPGHGVRAPPSLSGI